MNAVEIEEAVSRLAEQPFDATEFPYAFLEAFGNKPATLQRLKSGATNQSDIGGVLQRSNIHLKTCAPGQVIATLRELRESKKTATHKAKFILATDGIEMQAESLEGEGETLACAYPDFADHFGFFLPLAGISTVRQIRENAFDIKATGRLNRLYIELLKDNPEWGTAARREDLNHFMARLIFCFFAEDTSIFHGDSLFTATIEQMTKGAPEITHEVISELFRAMNIPVRHAGKLDNRYREAAKIKSWANVFPYVNGGLFSGSADAHVGTANVQPMDRRNDTSLASHSQANEGVGVPRANEGVGVPSVPRFSKIARSYLLHIGNLDWTKINPDIFGSMIQAVADDEERGALGMHYTSVPNILKVLNPLFLDDLRQALEEAGDNPRKLLNLRNRIARIRVFDPACGSGNFLVIAYKQLREIEWEINKRRGEADRKSDIPLTNFRGIELRHFSCEIARLALIIAEYQCDVLYRGQQLALAEFLPLEAANWITCGNALRLDWLSICPPTGKAVKNRADDLFETPLDQAEIDFANEGGETYICGNPPFKGTRKQEAQEKEDLQRVFGALTTKWKNVDYVGAWLMKAALYNDGCSAPFSFVATNSLCQGQQVPITWALLQGRGFRIRFAHTSFKWSNLAANKAGVTVVVTGVDREVGGSRWIYTDGNRREVENINPYLTEHKVDVVPAQKKPLFTRIPMEYGVYYSKSEGLILDGSAKEELMAEGLPAHFIRRFLGSTEYINGKERFCLWIADDEVEQVSRFQAVRDRIKRVRSDREETDDLAVNKLAATPHQFRERKGDEQFKIFIPIVSSENRQYFPAGLAGSDVIATNKAFYAPDAPLWMLSIVVSQLHLIWIGTICGRLRTDYSYSNTLGWNTFPVPVLTEQNKVDLTRCAEEILLAREAHFPATIAELYDPEKMPADLRAAHERNDETLERIYIGRRFKNDTERLEKLFELYTKMTANAPAAKKAVGRRKP